tara:strand:- start:125 stop:469 length:345 start_codon:yes stop_codon:yes gene_type:complete
MNESQLRSERHKGVEEHGRERDSERERERARARERARERERKREEAASEDVRFKSSVHFRRGDGELVQDPSVDRGEGFHVNCNVANRSLEAINGCDVTNHKFGRIPQFIAEAPE